MELIEHQPQVADKKNKKNRIKKFCDILHPDTDCAFILVIKINFFLMLYACIEKAIKTEYNINIDKQRRRL